MTTKVIKAIGGTKIDEKMQPKASDRPRASSNNRRAMRVGYSAGQRWAPGRSYFLAN